MSKILMVPVHLDALYLEQSQPSSEPTADFRHLPYYDRQNHRDVNSDTPWLGESVATAPFENSNMTLQAGVHLHWALPDGLCQGKVEKGKLVMPAVPNRWLIRRRPVGKPIPTKTWVIESDYLWPSNQHPASAVNIFYQAAEDGKPYRFLGRQLTLEEWQQNPNLPTDEYLQELTAIGYGESTFAAYYSNCMTVFGCHDRDLLTHTWDTVQYELLGWYGGETSNPKLVWERSALANTDFFIEPLRRWQVDGTQAPQTLVCYASIQLTNDTSEAPPSERKPARVALPAKVALGNTVSEALTALLAKEVAEELNDPELVSKIEEQLEALHIEEQLAAAGQDLGSQLRQYRHQKSFDPVSVSERWTIHADPPGAERLPEAVLAALRQLNEAQAQYGQRMSELEQARRQLYGDWCHYMRCVYRPLDSGRGQFLDIDEIVNYIKTRSLAGVTRSQQAVNAAEGQLWDIGGELAFRLLLINIEALRLNMAELVVYILKLEAMPTTEETTTKQNVAHERLDALISRLNSYQSVVYLCSTIIAYAVSQEPSQGSELAESTATELLHRLTLSEITQIMSYISFAHLKPPAWWLEEDSPAKLEQAQETLKQLITKIQARLGRDFLGASLHQPPQRYEREAVLAEGRTRPIPNVGSPNLLEPPPRPTEYKVQSIPGVRFWQPADPVVVITGGDVRVSDRHGRDGRNSSDGILRCSTYEMGSELEAELSNKDKSKNLIHQQLFGWLENHWKWVALQDALQERQLPDIYQLIEKKWLKKSEPPINSLIINSSESRNSLDNEDFESQVDTLLLSLSTLNPSSCIGFRTVKTTERPWHPLFLDWGIDMHPAESNASGALDRYDSDIITSNYKLGSQYPDLQPQPHLYSRDNPDRFSGRCILGDTPALILKERIEAVLRRRLMARLIRLGEIAQSSLSEYLDNLLQKRASLEPADAEQRATFRTLVELWANPENDTETETEYLRQLIDWYKKLAADNYNQVPLDALPTVPIEPLPTTPAALNALVQWYGERPLRTGGASRTADPLYVALLAYQKLFDNTFDNTDAINAKPNEKLQPRAFLGQSLSGFNEELIQWKLGLTLPIDNPIGLTLYRDFIQDVATNVGDDNEWVTEPANNFSPIRSGILRLDKLRLIDNFGQVSDLPCDEQVIVPTPYQQGRAGDAFLPPRLVQPAQAKFRWLDIETSPSPASEQLAQAAELEQSKEMVEAAARSPICGWLLPERLRGQLLVFAGDGSPLGSLAADKNSNTLEWVRAPGLPSPSFEERQQGRKRLKLVSDLYYDNATQGQPEPEPQIESNESELVKDLGELGASLPDPRLARVLLYLWATRSPQFLENFLKTLDDAMDNIDPEGTTSMGSLALLVGRPVAVVGAELDLVLKDQPAVRQDWDAFRMDQYRRDRDTDEFEQVQFRLRLGQYQSRNDGVVGYWIEESDRFAEDTFVAQAADDNDLSRKLEFILIRRDKLQEHLDNSQQLIEKGWPENSAIPTLQELVNRKWLKQQTPNSRYLEVCSKKERQPLESKASEPALDSILKELVVARINAHDSLDGIDDLNFTQSVADPPLQVTLLMDPRGKAHLTTGILPVKSIDIPRSLWEPALHAMRLCFSVAPILSRPQSRRVPLPALTDRQWSWLELEPNLGVSHDDLQRILEQEQPPLKIDALIEAGWLQKLNSITNRVYLSAPKDREVLANPELNSKLESIFRRLHLWQTLYSRPSIDRDALHQELFRLNAELGRVPLADYDLILRGSTQGKNLIIAKKMQSENENYYLIIIFNEKGESTIKEIGKEDPATRQKDPTELELIGGLEKVQIDSETLETEKSRLIQRITSYLESSDVYAGYDLILRGPTQGKNLIITKKIQSEDENYYRISIFNEKGEQAVKKIGKEDPATGQQDPTELELIGGLEKIQSDSETLETEKSELVQRITSYLGYSHVVTSCDLILRGLSSTDTLPTDGKSLIVARKFKNEDTQYLISIFGGTGHQITLNQVLADDSLVNKLDNKSKFPGLSDNLGRELTQRILMTLYNLILEDGDIESTEASRTPERKNLVIASKKGNNEDRHYLVSIFDEAGNQAVRDRKLTKLGLIAELDQAQTANLSNERKLNLLLKIASDLGYGKAELILRRAQSRDAIPTNGKNLVIVQQANNNGSNHYSFSIFNGSGKQVAINQAIADPELIKSLDKALEFRELGRSITANLGYEHPELDRLVEKKWLEETQPPSDRIYVNPKEDRQPLDDWALEILLEPRLAELSLALISPGEEVDFNPGIEVREGWLLLQLGDSEKKT